MDEYRRTVYQQLEVHNLLDVTLVSSQLLMLFQLYFMSHKTVMKQTHFQPVFSDKHQDKLLCPRKLTTHVFIHCSTNFFSVCPLCHQITSTAGLAQRPPLTLPSPGHRSIPNKSLLSSDTFRKEKKLSSHQHQQPAKQTVVFQHSNLPDAPFTPAAVPNIDVSISFDPMHRLYLTSSTPVDRRLQIFLSIIYLITILFMVCIYYKQSFFFLHTLLHCCNQALNKLS